jgi:hypothetical protein
LSREERMRQLLTPGWILIWIIGLLLIAVLVVILVSVATGSGSGSS